jgi:hypothetical protein
LCNHGASIHLYFQSNKIYFFSLSVVNNLGKKADIGGVEIPDFIPLLF